MKAPEVFVRIFLRFAAFPIFLLYPCGAFAEGSRLYFSASGGGVDMPTMTLQIVDEENEGTGDYIRLEHEPGLEVSASLGLIFDHIRLGLEATAMRAGIEGSSGEEDEETLRMALALVLTGEFLPPFVENKRNAFYVPYAGFGAVYQMVEVSDGYKERMLLRENEITSNGAVKALAGVRFPFWGPCEGSGIGCFFGASLDVRYELVYFRQKDFNHPQDREDGKTSHAVRMGLVVDF